MKKYLLIDFVKVFDSVFEYTRRFVFNTKIFGILGILQNLRKIGIINNVILVKKIIKYQVRNHKIIDARITSISLKYLRFLLIGSRLLNKKMDSWPCLSDFNRTVLNEYHLNLSHFNTFGAIKS